MSVTPARFRRPAHGKALGTAALIVALIALTLAIFAVFYQKQVAPLRAGTDQDGQLYTSLTGLANIAAKNALDPRYTDADGNLIADCPADASKQMDPATLTFSYVVSESQDEFKTAFAGLEDAISRATGKPVVFMAYTDVTQKLQDLRDGKLAITGVATGSVPLAVCTAGFVPIAQAADADGGAAYKMEIIAPADSKLTGVADLKGHELTLTEPTSNSGYKAPLVMMREAGLLPPRDYLIRYSQGHIQSIAGIKDKKFEAAAVASDVLAREENAGHIAKTDYKVIYTGTQDFPEAALGYAHDLKPELAAKIKAAVLAYDWKGSGLEKLFAAEGKSKFVPADYKKDWDYIRRTDEAIGYAYTLPPSMPPATQPLVPTTQTAMAEQSVSVTLDENQEREYWARVFKRQNAAFERERAATRNAQ